jgi:hypothetical protein
MTGRHDAISDRDASCAQRAEPWIAREPGRDKVAQPRAGRHVVRQLRQAAQQDELVGGRPVPATIE